jgi:hypothetical protein
VRLPVISFAAVARPMPLLPPVTMAESPKWDDVITKTLAARRTPEFKGLSLGKAKESVKTVFMKTLKAVLWPKLETAQAAFKTLRAVC